MRRPKSKNWTNETEMEILLNLEVEGYCTPGYEPITNRAPEDCDPGEAGMVEDFAAYITRKDGTRIDITEFLSPSDNETLKSDLMTDYVDSFYYDNDAAYEASVGK